MEQYMSDLVKHQYGLPQIRVTPRMPLRLTVIITSLLLSVMPLLTGCGGGEGDTPSTTTPASTGVTASLAWSPVPDPSVHSYFVHYGRQSPGQPGSCSYEHSLHVASPSDMVTILSATITDLDPNTPYFFAVSAYNGLESACSNEVATVTPPASV